MNNSNFDYEYKYIKYPKKPGHRELTVPQHDRIPLKIYMPEKYNMYENINILYKDFDGNNRVLMTEKIKLSEGSSINKLNGSGLILK